VNVKDHFKIKLKPISAIIGFLAAGAEMSCGLALAQEDSPKSLPEVLVTATRTSHNVAETPGASYVVTREQMEARNLVGIDSAVSTLPGVYNRRGAGVMDAKTAIILRGMSDQKRTLVMQDGMPLNDGYTGGVTFGGLPVQDFERVEVALGAGASLYGNNAMGGVVNLVTRMPEKREFRFSTGYGDGLGSDLAMHNLNRNYASYGDKFDNGLHLLVSVGDTRTDGYRSALNVQSAKPTAGLTGWTPTTSATGDTKYLIGDKGNMTWSDNHGAIRAAFDLPQRGQIRLAYQQNAFKYSYGRPKSYLRNAVGEEVYGYGSVREASFLEGGGEKIRDLYQASLETPLGGARLKINTGINDTGTNWYVTPGTGAGTTLNGGPGTVSSTPTRLNFADAQLTFTPTVKQILVLGTSIRSEKADTTERSLSDWRNENTTGATTYMAGGKSQTVGLFLQDEIGIAEKLTGSIGVRWDDWQTSDGYANSVGAAGYPKSYPSRSEDAWRPKFGLVYRESSNAIFRTSIGRAFRAPTVYELYRTRLQNGVTYNSNPDLKSETADTWDFGGDIRPWQGAELKATIYFNKMRDMIYRRKVSSTEQEYINAGKATGKGLELDYRQKLPENWTLLAGGALNKTRLVENKASASSVGKQFEMAPERTGHFGIEWHQGSWDFLGLAKHVSKRYANDDNSDATSGVYGSYDAYTTVDLKLGYRIDRNLKLAFSIDNALNKNYFSYYQAPGRSYFMELSGQF
jgi:iron complex outermembrane recepter protein